VLCMNLEQTHSHYAQPLFACFAADTWHHHGQAAGAAKTRCTPNIRTPHPIDSWPVGSETHGMPMPACPVAVVLPASAERQRWLWIGTVDQERPVCRVQLGKAVVLALLHVQTVSPPGPTRVAAIMITTCSCDPRPQKSLCASPKWCPRQKSPCAPSKWCAS